MKLFVDKSTVFLCVIWIDNFFFDLVENFLHQMRGLYQ